ncbi:MAG: NAD(P)-binding domain-containing protein [Deltaproteobacteria bacterium]
MGSAGGDIFDVIIVGAGPAGISAAARAEANKLKYIALEKGAVANTLDYYYQNGKFVMAQPQSIPLRSDVSFQAGSREEILDVWNGYTSKNSLKIKTKESVSAVAKKGDLFEVKTSSGVYQAKRVVLAIGKLGNPRKVGAPGEDSPHISDRLVDPTAYSDRHVVVVGGGDSAAEVVLALVDNNKVSIVEKGADFFYMNSDLLGKIREKIDSKQLSAYLSATVELFEADATTITLPDREVRIKSDIVILKIGAEVPRKFLESCGVAFSSKDVTALPIISDKYETNVPGLYIIGATGGRDLIKTAMNEGYEVIESIAGKSVEPIDESLLKEKLALIPGASVNEKLDYITARVPMFTGIQRQLLRELMTQSDVTQARKDQLILKQGDYSTNFFSIVTGGVQVVPKGGSERDIFIKQGEFFGEMGLLADRRNSATVKASEHSILIETPRRRMLKLINSEQSVKRIIDEAFILRTLQSTLSISISAEEFQTIAPKLEVVAYKKGDVICKEAEVSDSFYVIRLGSAKISKKAKDGSDYVITYISTGNYFGEAALLSEDHVRTATVSAATKSEAIRILSSDFKALMQKHPQLESRVRAEMGRRKVETSAILQSPHSAGDTGVMADFIKYGVVESTDVLIIDESKCIRCDNCVKACEGTHGGHTRLDRRPGPSFGNIHVPIACRHCEGAPCLQDCPPGDAIVRGADGVVAIDEDKCIGCGNCSRFCPYGVIFMISVTNKPTLMKSVWQGAVGALGSLVGKKAPHAAKIKKGLAVKCDLCHTVDGGPACVRNCPTSAAVRVKPDYFKKVEFS